MGVSPFGQYFAYDADMSSAHLGERCPSRRNPRPGVLADHVWLCNERGVATLEAVEGREVHGVVWELDLDDLDRLDLAERARAGVTGRTVVTVTVGGSARLDAVAYIDTNAEPGPPVPGHLDVLLAGIDEHRLPDTWRQYVAAWSRAGQRVPAHEIDDDSGPQTLAELLAVPGVREVSTLRSAFGFMAIHGGDLEAGTDVIAARAAERSDASFYGVAHPEGHVAHLSSIRYQPDESAALAAFVDHVDVAVSVHGYGRRSQWLTLLLGGSNRALAEHIGAALAERLEGYEIVTDLEAIPKELRGLHPANPVNRPAGGGVQLELPPRVRGLSPLSPPPGDDGLSPQTRALIDGLVAAASAWPAP